MKPTNEEAASAGSEITREETPQGSETFTAPRIERTFPPQLWLVSLESAPEGMELEGEEEVDNRAGEQYEESDRSSRTEVASDFGTALVREGKDRPG